MTRPPLPHDEVVLVLDFGGQTAQLIARRIREAGVLSMLVHPSTPASELAAYRPKGIVLSGGPASIYDPGAPTFDPGVLEMGVPVLGVCYGMQLACSMLGCEVNRADHREFGRASLQIHTPGELLHAIPTQTAVWMSHGDQVLGVDHAFETLASTSTCPHAAVRHRERAFYGVQFHPEVTHTPHGAEMLQNFVFRVCRCRGDWRMSNFLEHEIARVRERVGDRRVLCGLSGGVDSSVVAALLHRAIGDRLTCVFVDNGLLRKNERRLVEATFRDHFEIDLHVANAGDAFLGDLAGVTDPQEKRRRIGHRFIEVFKSEAKRLEATHGAFAFLAQGTLYPDVIESGHGSTGKSQGSGSGGAGGGFSANIKLHHNVGGLPEELGFELVEPLRDLFKDEVRKLGEVLGLPEQLVWRHPFPGPGLAVRVLGEVTREGLEVLRNCDEILLEEIVSAGLYRQTSQVFTVLLPISSVGVMGDGRTYEQVVAVRAVETQDFMSADWSRLPYDLLARVSSRIINEVRGVNRVVYDISSKPPATIEWE